MIYISSVSNPPSYLVEREGSKAEVHKEDVFAKWCVRKLAKVYRTDKKFCQYFLDLKPKFYSRFLFFFLREVIDEPEA